MSLSIGSVTKRSSLALQRKLSKNPQFELIDFKLKFFEKIKNEKDQDIFINNNQIEVNAVSGFSSRLFKGEASDKNGKVDKNTKKFLLHSKSIIGETNGGKSWLIEIPFNQRRYCLTLSKKFIPKIKDLTIDDLIDTKEDEILEVFWHLNHRTVFYTIDKNSFSYVGRKKLKYVTTFLKTIHLVAVTAMKWEVEKVSIVKIIKDGLSKELDNADDPNGEKLKTMDDIIIQLRKNRNDNYHSIKRSELKKQETANVIKDVSRPPDPNNLSWMNEDKDTKQIDDLDAELLKNWI